MATRGVWRIDLRGDPPDTDDPTNIDDGTGGRGTRAIDLAVDVPDGSTVGDLAHAIVAHLNGEGPSDRGPSDEEQRGESTLEVDGTLLERSHEAARAAPRNGSTVRVRCALGSDSDEVPISPVALHAGTGTTWLRYGTNRLRAGVSVHVGHDVVVTDAAGASPSVNGAAVRGNAALRDGDMVRIGGWTATIELTDVLRPPTPGGATRRIPLSRGIWDPHEPDTVDLPQPPDRFRAPGFPWLTAMVPVLMAAAAWVATRSLLMVAFMGFSFVYVLASGIESRREARAADRFTVARFREVLHHVASDLQRRRDEQESRDQSHHPSIHEAISWAHPPSHRLWERHGSHPAPLVVRLGTAPREPDDRVTRPALPRPDLSAQIDEVCAHNDPAPRPVTVDLASSGGVAVIADEVTASSLAASLVAQLALTVPPGELSLRMGGGERTGGPLGSDERWWWFDWLPHLDVQAPHRVTVHRHHSGSAHDQRPVSLREAGSAGADGDGDGPTEAIIWTAADTIGLPESIRAVVMVDNHGIATLQLDHEPPVELSAEHVGADALEVCARRLAGLAPGVDGPGGPGAIPDAVGLAQLGLPRDAEEVLAGWHANRAERGDRHLRFPLGAVAGGGVLTVDLVRDGPHALVAGTTGSGKSELLRTMLLGLAARYPPEQLNLFLIDYKGGAAFGPLAALPHCVGLLTDLRGDGAGRTLTALRAELRRREAILEAAGASDLADLADPACPASLTIVIDEFATLVAEVPDFLDGMLDVAQRGRSLGIHLVLATQRPTGVISDAIRANTSLRIALRLPDADDSTDVIDSPLAAGLPRGVPGRALVRLGHDELVRTQVAYSGGHSRGRPGLRVRRLHGATAEPRASAPPGRSADARGTAPAGASADPHGPAEDIVALVSAIRSAAEACASTVPHRPVPPPLPELLEPEELTGHCEQTAADGVVVPLVIGIRDRPESQMREPFGIDPDRTAGVLVTGVPGSGVSTTLLAIADAASRQGGWEIHAIDATGGLGSLAGGPSVREVVDASDHEPLRRLLEELLEGPGDNHTGSRSTNGGALHRARRLLLLDGFGAFEAAQESVNRGWATSALIELASDARRRDLVVAVSARRRMEVPQSLLCHLGERIAHRVLDEDEATMVDAPAELAGFDLPPGRARVRGHWVQVARPAPPPKGHANPPRRLAREIPLSELSGQSAAAQDRPWCLPIGIAAHDLRPSCIDLSDAHALICGPPGSGRTTTLRTIAASAERHGIVVVDASEDGSNLESVPHVAAQHPTGRVLVLIDDLDRVIDDPGTASLLHDAITDPGSSALRMVAAADPLGLLRSYDDAVTQLRSMRTGILLGDDAHDNGDVLHHDLRARDDVPTAPGRGWLVHRGRAEIIQIAH